MPERQQPTQSHRGLATALLSDAGQLRANNEDALGEDNTIGLLVLADGMGGHNAGEVASGIAVEAVLEVVRREWPSLPAAGPTARSPDVLLLLRRAIEDAHRRIHAMSQTHVQYAGMGTTIVACLLRDDRLSIAHVGDSRLYRLRDGQLQQLTRDHSLLEELVARGRYSREDAQLLVRRNIVTRALGVEPQVEVDVAEHALVDGDLVLLCSDGLSDLVDDRTIGLTLQRHADNLAAGAADLIRLANDAGGNDNISVALARMDAPPARRWVERLRDWL